MIHCLRNIFTGLLLFTAIQLSGQGTYNMSNATVNDCYGNLLDSDAGLTTDHYDHNEDFIFRICPPGASQVTLNFSQFCTEAVLDVIRIFDGPDTFSTLILTHSGSNVPGPVIANSGCMTIHFKTDANVSCTGWIANWTVNLNPPVPPAIDPVANISCFSNTVILTLDQNIPCDSIYGSAFSISGPGGPVISSASATNCIGGMTNSITLVLNPTISQNGNHIIQFVYHYRDICDSVWTFNISQNFNVTDCPISADIQSSADTVCLGNCVTLTGSATGGDPSTYAYAWNNGLPPTAGPHVVCPLVTTTYRLTVSDQGPSPSDIAIKTIFVFPKPNGGADRTLCQYGNPIILFGSPGGGLWSGTGITNPFNGTFDPDSSGSGLHPVYYILNGCADTVNINVLPVYAGPDQASCPGASAFAMVGFNPPGGTWTGPNITANGIFNPINPGSYTVTYNATNGCTHSKTINVDTIIVQGLDTTCTNRINYYLSFTPYGGVWSGNGITDPLVGIFSPQGAGNGLHTLTYTINGCVKSTDIFVQSINGGPNRVTCPLQGIYTIPNPSPSGGYWIGRGITDTALGLFDPFDNNGNNFTTDLVYNFNGCTDTIRMYVRNTSVGVDSLWFCESDSFIYLNWASVRRTPSNGNWSGPGITDPNFPGIFDPKVAGPGNHVLRYLANTCEDTMVIVVYPLPQTQGDTTVCQTSGAFPLIGLPPGGTWSGTGITNSTSGIFDPQVTGLGSFEVVYDNFIGCKDTMFVNVDPLININFPSIGAFHCYKDTLIPMNATPSGGTYAGPGLVGSSFNPMLAGTGIYWIYYNHGSGDCAVVDSIQVEVGEPISISMDFAADSICYGDYIIIGATASGGFGGNYTYKWNQGLGFGRTKNVNPVNSTNYSVTVTDGCSEAENGTLNVHVHPQIKITLSHGPKVCYGVKGWARATAASNKNYSYLWSTLPAKTTDTIQDFPGTYDLTVTDNVSGCSKDFQALIDGYNFINAKFTTNPNLNCVSFLNPVYRFLDNSIGGSKGNWSFGDGASTPYVPGSQVAHRYADTGKFLVKLYIENAGGCNSEYEQIICVKPERTLWVPNGFTPNGDGNNETFRATGIGIVEFKMLIFNRWGEKLFESYDIDSGWDGTYNGEKVKNDVYTYLIIYKDITSPNTQFSKGVVAVVR